MPYFPEVSEAAPYRCQGCGGWFRYNESGIACCVAHAPGTCCHVGETPVDAPRQISGMLEHETNAILLERH